MTKSKAGQSGNCVGMAIGLVIGLNGSPLAAASDPADLCENAANQASTATGVPLSVLQAIALVESGHADGGRQRPWPWTVNFGGQGFWFANADEAQIAVAERQSLGTTNFDVGCFQLNHRWHGDAFDSVAAMFDPQANALYAARFLRQLFDQTGSWTEAAAAYHSRTPEYADRYRAKFEAVQDGLESSPAFPVDVHRENRFPLLQPGDGGALGSLVPQLAGGASLFSALP